MNRPRHQFLAGSGRAHQENGRGARRDQPGHPVKTLHGGSIADHSVEWFDRGGRGSFDERCRCTFRSRCPRIAFGLFKGSQQR